MSDFGPASGNGTLNEGSLAIANVFVEVHTQNNVSSAITSGVPGGLAGPASGLNNLGPGDSFGYSAPTAYGTVSSGSAVSTVNNAGGTSASFGPNNPSGAGGLNLFRMKNPA